MPRSSPGRSGSLVDVVVYPVKGLTGQHLDQVHVTNRGIPFDRMLAMAPRTSRAVEREAPTHETFSELYSLDTEERMAGIETHLEPDTSRLTVKVEGHLVLECTLDGAEGVGAAMRVLANVLDLDEEDRPQLLRAAPQFNFGWPGIEDPSHMWACHLVNLASVRDLESRTGVEVDPRRFRANLYVDLHDPWVERTWVGERFLVGDVELECVQGSTRCATTEVNPRTAKRDLPVPRLLMQHYGHTELGLYATIVTPGILEPGLDVHGPVGLRAGLGDG